MQLSAHQAAQLGCTQLRGGLQATWAAVARLLAACRPAYLESGSCQLGEHGSLLRAAGVRLCDGSRSGLLHGRLLRCSPRAVALIVLAQPRVCQHLQTHAAGSEHTQAYLTELGHQPTYGTAPDELEQCLQACTI